MKAYHNRVKGLSQYIIAVFQWTKIQNWKLITTLLFLGYFFRRLYFNELRYKIESLSQHFVGFTFWNVAVFQWTKIQNWKLITTYGAYVFLSITLYFNELRYKIESLSQHKISQSLFHTAVFQWTKIQNWKLITTFRVCFYVVFCCISMN